MCLANISYLMQKVNITEMCIHVYNVWMYIHVHHVCIALFLSVSYVYVVPFKVELSTSRSNKFTRSLIHHLPVKEHGTQANRL